MQERDADGHAVIREINERLVRGVGIRHTTLQVETAPGCGPERDGACCGTASR
ncbi:MAG: hypothetical protein FJ098_08250 [Deltaproteobacteria bacterium]|nr:hypothetical protein [Deltaproteobacteria bacterium]